MIYHNKMGFDYYVVIGYGFRFTVDITLKEYDKLDDSEFWFNENEKIMLYKPKWIDVTYGHYSLTKLGRDLQSPSNNEFELIQEILKRGKFLDSEGNEISEPVMDFYVIPYQY